MGKKTRPLTCLRHQRFPVKKVDKGNTKQIKNNQGTNNNNSTETR
ncbi:hypothetical protein SAMN05660649_00692 [Desulfotomaculum arcticum]|uniref:Uncharacterized protein n=1 Tax=Desulfotruncus arcticus DSM 17038 TaxID=1121424 RepID=A0A1I2P2Y5_9FIRM|nr:hypothetical protein SAMN05660649_00692 [Desulfotomaculum arcticum] [Desulfotruncus arcticus DSM 17038]